MIQDLKLAAALLKRKEWRIRQRERGLAINGKVPEKAVCIYRDLFKLPATDFSKWGSPNKGEEFLAREGRGLGINRFAEIDGSLSDDVL